ncbi:hypothetical protein [Streptomyces shenzhenensis]|uniref:hypothetical protein n=1 Tax=Streptomyces shenzhenensis TaxID=943815 RepID=UPI001F281D5D|nr:hypothetical protein [Streptomyces shenzhenensis]
MGQRGRHAAPRAGMRKIRRVAAVLLTAGALTSAGNGAAFADMLEDLPLNGDANIDQDGQQNLNCNNSARVIRLNVAETERHDRVCADHDGRTHHHGARQGGAEAVGATTEGPQLNVAQTGKQNLACGNSADLITVNVTGDMHWDTTCVVTDRDVHRRGRQRAAHIGDARAVGGTSAGPQIDAAQTGEQNLFCGNSADTLTVNIEGTISKRTTCVAAEHPASGPGAVHRGRASVRPGDAIGAETDAAQNGKQNQTCGNPGTGLDFPLGATTRQVTCTVHAG